MTRMNEKKLKMLDDKSENLQTCTLLTMSAVVFSTSDIFTLELSLIFFFVRSIRSTILSSFSPFMHSRNWIWFSLPLKLKTPIGNRPGKQQVLDLFFVELWVFNFGNFRNAICGLTVLSNGTANSSFAQINVCDDDNVECRIWIENENEKKNTNITHSSVS